MKDIDNILLNLVEEQRIKEAKNNIWKDSLYYDLSKLQRNNIGIIGEKFIASLCKLTKIQTNFTNTSTNKHVINYIPIDIKIALQGSKTPSFQHELGEIPWKYAKKIIFVDISPMCIYITIFRNFSEETYKTKKLLPIFNNKIITWRKNMGAFKLDTTPILVKNFRNFMVSTKNP